MPYRVPPLRKKQKGDGAHYGKRRKNTSWRFPLELYEQVKEAAGIRGISLNEWVIRAVVGTLATERRMRQIERGLEDAGPRGY